MLPKTIIQLDVRNCERIYSAASAASGRVAEDDDNDDSEPEHFGRIASRRAIAIFAGAADLAADVFVKSHLLHNLHATGSPLREFYYLPDRVANESSPVSPYSWPYHPSPSHVCTRSPNTTQDR